MSKATLTNPSIVISGSFYRVLLLKKSFKDQTVIGI
jgi:hypothetical protein